MEKASSAGLTCRGVRAASEYTATVRTPNSWQARMMRTAISPRFAMRTFWNMRLGERLNQHERLAVLHRVAVLREDPHHPAAHVALDFVEELHRLDDAHGLPRLHHVALADEGRSIRGGGAVEGAPHR